MSRARTLPWGILAVLIAAMSTVGTAGAVDWSKVDGKDVTVFYPGQSSWEWVLTTSDHDGAKDIRKGKTCWDCHEGEETEIGSKIVSGKELEPNPVAGRRPAFDVNVKAAHDGERLYIRLSWPDSGASTAGKGDSEYEARATVLIGDKSLVAFDRAGCWSACHDDMTGMPSAGGKERQKYLTNSRTKITRQGGGDSYKSDAELAKLLEEGTFVEFWQARFNQGAASPADGYILEKIHESNPPEVSVTGGKRNGQWEVVLSRKLNADGPGRRGLDSGTVVPIGIAVHDAHADGRHHHVSFKRTLAVDHGDADIIATKQ